MFHSLRLLVVVTSILASASSVRAHTPVEFLEVSTAEPARLIEHAVDLKSVFDDERVTTDLAGPKMFSRSVGCLDRPAKKLKAYLNWFQIVEPREEPARQVSVLDLVRGYEKKMLTIGAAEFLLTPAQQITSGAPDPIPEGLDHYKAYRVVDPPTVSLDVKLTDSPAKDSRKIGKPIFVCLPVSEWHHDDTFKVSHANDCFVVYELDAQPHDEKVSTLDQFGLNVMKTGQSKWICVRAALLSKE